MKKGQVYSVKRVIILRGYVVVDADSHADGASTGASNAHVSTDLAHDDCSFTLVGPDKIVTFRANSHAERVEWVSTLKTILQVSSNLCVPPSVASGGGGGGPEPDSRVWWRSLSIPTHG